MQRLRVTGVDGAKGAAMRSVELLLLALLSLGTISNGIAQGTAADLRADWVVVGRAHTFTVYAHPATVRRSGGKATLWEIKDYNTAQMHDGEPYMSQKTQTEYDCKEGRFRIIALSLHSGNLGGGKVIWSDPDPDNWKPVASGRTGVASRKFACGEK
jgi:hypothetical protein